METENDNTIPFLDTLVIKDSEGRLTTSVYRKTTHTDQYLSCDSHHPQSVKHGVVKCLYDRSKNIITKPSVISEEKKHLSSVLVSNEYPCSFVANVTKSKNQPISSKDPTIEIKSTAVPPYLKGLSKQLRRCLQSMAYDLFQVRYNTDFQKSPSSDISRLRRSRSAASRTKKARSARQ